MAGTIEGLAVELARALEPLQQQFVNPAGAVALFAEMGLPLPPPVQTAIETAPQLPGIVADVTSAAAEIPGLAAAVAAQDPAAITAAIARIAPPTQRAYEAVRALADRVRAAFPADLSALTQEIRDLITALPERLIGWVIVSYLEDHHPVLLRTLALPGILESTEVPASGEQAALTRRAVHLNRLTELLSDPDQLATDVYGWGDAVTPANSGLLLRRVHDLFTVLEFFAILDSTVPELRAMLLTVRPSPGDPPTALDVTLSLGSLTGLDLLLSAAGSLAEARLRATGSMDVGTGLQVTPPATVTSLAPTGALDGQVTLSISRTATPAAPLVLFGRLDGTRLTAVALRASAGTTFSAGAGLSAAAVLDAEVEDGQIVVSLEGSDGFLASVLPGSATLDFDLGVRWTESDGLTFRGGAALNFTIPLGIDVGPARLERLDLTVRPSVGATAGIAFEGRLSGGIALGPLSASVEGVGAAVDLLFQDVAAAPTLPAGAVDLGPVAIAFRFLAPTGLGLAIDAGPISGGGFIGFDPATGRYSGMFEVKLAAVGVQATGLLDTRLPGGRDGFALLVVLRASFQPIQVGFGFALSSVGGLLAVNRRMDVDVLRNRMASGTAGRILAPEDPIRNAPVLLADLAAVFPPTDGVAVVGPTLQLSWAELVRFDIGIFIELPGPRRIVLLGSARATVVNPSGGKAYLQIRLDILGVVDFAQQTLTFDAVLIDSHLMEILELTGGAAFRLSWGAEPYVVLTVGGFHPAYSPAPLVFPSSLTRIAMVRGTPNDFLYMRFEGYFAVTSNTLQFGASIEVIIRVGSFDIRGFVGFDAIVRLQPLHFEFQMSASVKVRWKGRNLGGLDLRGQLSGPGPVVFRGKVCFEILWCDICFEETFALGSSTPPAVTPVASALQELVNELEDVVNIRSGGGTDPWVTVAPATDASLPVVSSLGQAVWTQERAPLDLLLQRFEGAPLTLAETVTATGPHVTAPEIDWFAPGSFAELSDADALNRRSFERLHAGVRLGVDGTDDGQSADLTVTVKQIRIPAPPTVPDPPALAMPGWLMRAVAGRNGAIERDVVVPALAVRDEGWVVRGADGSVAVGGLSQAQAHQLAVAGAAGTAVAATDTVAAMAF